MTVALLSTRSAKGVLFRHMFIETWDEREQRTRMLAVPSGTRLKFELDDSMPDMANHASMADAFEELAEVMQEYVENASEK